MKLGGLQTSNPLAIIAPQLSGNRILLTGLLLVLVGLAFKIAAFPIKIERGSGGWARAVAILE